MTTCEERPPVYNFGKASKHNTFKFSVILTLFLVLVQHNIESNNDHTYVQRFLHNALTVFVSVQSESLHKLRQYYEITMKL